MMKLGNVYVFILTFGFLGLMLPAGTDAWSKEGHIMTCQIAQSLLEPEAAEIVAKLLPDYANGDLSSLCTWPDQIRHWYKYRWTSPLHFIDTPDKACTFKYDRAIQNFTSQLMHYREGTSDRRYNMTEALLFVSHFMGDIHQDPVLCANSTRGVLSFERAHNTGSPGSGIMCKLKTWSSLIRTRT
ncbi:unnamed protein product [Rhodiola kirilowii]